MSDVPSVIYKRYGVAAIIVTIVVCLCVWGLTHYAASSGNEVSVFWGLVKYTKQTSIPQIMPSETAGDQVTRSKHKDILRPLSNSRATQIKRNGGSVSDKSTTVTENTQTMHNSPGAVQAINSSVTVHNMEPRPPIVTASEEKVSGKAGLPYGLKVSIHTTALITPISFTVTFDKEIDGTADTSNWVYTKRVLSVEGVNHNVVFIRFQSPPFTPASPFEITVYSRYDVRLSSFAWDDR